MLNDKEIMLGCAHIAADICGVPAEWIYSQWAHESTNVTPGDPDWVNRFAPPWRGSNSISAA